MPGAACAGLAGTRVLVVDDVPTNLAIARSMLKRFGIQADCVASGMQAVEAMKPGNEPYGAVFMDLLMPGMDGAAATLAIREAIGAERALALPIIALTACESPENEEMLQRGRFQAYLAKPLTAPMLGEALCRWMCPLSTPS